MNKTNLVLFGAFVAILAVVGRIIPHPWNFTPMGSLMLFSGFLMPRKWLWLPLAALALSDVIIGPYQFSVMATVYASYAFTLGASYAARRRYSFTTAIGASIASSVIFYLTTNAAVWAASGMYSPDFSGLMASYVAGIPFFRNSFAGYIAYSTLIFGAYEAVCHALQHQQRRLQEQYQTEHYHQ
ncbi:MAG: hypothetical protein HYW81_00865 [Parcubacteria group bacterium]|nr:hypothetical protein [Parcubacteria group bacterium]